LSLFWIFQQRARDREWNCEPISASEYFLSISQCCWCSLFDIFISNFISKIDNYFKVFLECYQHSEVKVSSIEKLRKKV
jgi:hypothetical protein